MENKNKTIIQNYSRLWSYDLWRYISVHIIILLLLTSGVLGIAGSHRHQFQHPAPPRGPASGLILHLVCPVQRSPATTSGDSTIPPHPWGPENISTCSQVIVHAGHKPARWRHDSAAVWALVHRVTDRQTDTSAIYHGLRGSASPVLTATGLVNGKCQILTPYRIEATNRSLQNLSQVITSATPTCAKFGANPPRGSFCANGWNITKIIFIYIYLFSQAPLEVRPLGRFWRVIVQMTRYDPRVCLLGDWLTLLPL